MKRICGIDEAGRGSLAGPVCAAAAVLPSNFPTETLNDSKKLSASRREAARILIMEKALAWGVGWASNVEIDRINILRASLLAMERAFEALKLQNPAVEPSKLNIIVDGDRAPALPVPCQTMVKADAQIPAVMAASILAKTCRDRLMIRYSWLYPQYGYESHKGYPTKAHYKKIRLYGTSPIQRMSFRYL
ncbi:MAG: ribonuclease HII [Treponema sp.]|jgi:ribonuclease HII|nr:ribonuclease HII [Treponema sp.]